MVQIRSADEPMTAFFKVRNTKFVYNRTVLTMGSYSALRVAISGRKTNESLWAMYLKWEGGGKLVNSGVSVGAFAF